MKVKRPPERPLDPLPTLKLKLSAVILAAVGIGAFFYFGGEANVDVKKPSIQVSSSETPS